jgi:hypothetical protein
VLYELLEKAIYPSGKLIELITTKMLLRSERRAIAPIFIKPFLPAWRQLRAIRIFMQSVEIKTQPGCSVVNSLILTPRNAKTIPPITA